MTQPQRQDERVLDYIYGELGPDERAAFEAELSQDAELRAEVESLQQVHQQVRGLPKLEQSPDSVGRMTALLMQQAAQQAQQQGAAPDEAKGDDGGGGRILPFRLRGVRRLFQSPASGIFAAAAAALFWVVFKSQSPSPSPRLQPALEPAAPIAAPAAAPPKPAAALPETTAAVTNEQPPAVADKASEGRAVPADELKKSEDLDSVQKDSKVAGTSLRDAFARGMKEAKPAATPSLDGLLVADGRNFRGAGKGTGGSGAATRAPAKPAEKMVLAQLEPMAKKKAEKADVFESGERARSYAQPPPPPPAEPEAAKPMPPGSVRAGIAETQAHRKERIVEELANQELAGMPAPSGGSARPSASAAPPPQQAEAEGGRYAQAPTTPAAPTASAGDDQASAAAPQAYAQNTPPPPAAAPAAPSYSNAQSAGPRRAVSNNSDGETAGNTLLASVQEQLRQGRCADALASLQRLEQAFPATRGLAEARTQWQRTCQGQNQAPSLQNYDKAVQLAQPSEAPVQMNRSSLPMPAPRPSSINVNKAAKRAAPAKSKAADVAY